MICPVCQTAQGNSDDIKACVQCGADLDIHRLLRNMAEEIQMKEIKETKETTKEAEKKTAQVNFVLFFQIIQTLMLLFCTLWGIFVGVRFLLWMDHPILHRTLPSDKWAETGIEQLQQMNTTIQQALNLILDQHRENQLLQEKVQLLTDQLAIPCQAETIRNITLPVNRQGMMP